MEELTTRGRIYAYRYRPEGGIKGKPINEYKGKCLAGKAFQVMIDNNLDFEVALYPYELVTYGETGQVCQNWLQYRLIKKYLEELTEDQTLVVESGHPLGLFPSKPTAPRVIITNSMMIGMYDNLEDWEIAEEMGVANYETARALYDMGAKRVVLARELSLDDIATLRAKTPKELEIETFVHGAMCVSFSGRCLLSNYLIDRDANRGQCAQPCRWKFHLVEERRPGEYFQISEDNGTYILNSRDMRMIEHIPELMAAGVDSLKIEGRAKSSYYAAAVTNAYRHAVDAALRGEPLDEIWVQETEHVSHREYSTGFYYDHSGPGQFYGSAMYFTDCDVAAYVEDCGDDLVGKLTQRNKFSVGDTLSLITPDGGKPVTFTAQGMKNSDGEDLETLPHPMMEFTMPLPVKAPKYSIIRKMK